MTASGLLHRLTLILVINDQSVPLLEFREVILGRFAPTDSSQPDIDLGPYGAEHKGVSRRHIRINHAKGKFWVIDLGSTNGTWLNGQRLKPVAEYPIQHGDRLRLGELDVEVKLGTTGLNR
jgi:pSer/pThr/pTyr-binding forkhead associated (FHA) protein